MPGCQGAPLEFADGAYRYGHSQVRHRYVLKAGGDARPIFLDWSRR